MGIFLIVCLLAIMVVFLGIIIFKEPLAIILAGVLIIFSALSIGYISTLLPFSSIVDTKIPFVELSSQLVFEEEPGNFISIDKACFDKVVIDDSFYVEKIYKSSSRNFWHFKYYETDFILHIKYKWTDLK